VPHHLIDVAAPTELFTAGDYARLTRRTLQEIRDRGHLPIVVGGTGLYLRALLEGLSEGPPRSDELRERLRARAEERGAVYLHRILLRLDLELAARIHPNDVAKVVRAIEVCLAARRPMSDLWRDGRDPLQGFRILRIGLDPDRTALYARINLRAKRMFDDGLVEETRALLERYGDSARPLTSLGYKEAVAVLRGEMTREAAIAAAQQGHRNYAKRQMTWFRREVGVEWMNDFGTEEAVQHVAIAAVEAER